MNHIMLAIAAIAFTAAAPATAAQKRTTETPLYWVTYDPGRDVYCIKFYSDAQIADPHPGGPSFTCRNREAWAKQQVFIDDPHRDPARARP